MVSVAAVFFSRPPLPPVAVAPPPGGVVATHIAHTRETRGRHHSCAVSRRADNLDSIVTTVTNLRLQTACALRAYSRLETRLETPACILSYSLYLFRQMVM